MNNLNIEILERKREELIYNIHRYYAMPIKKIDNILYKKYGIRMHSKCKKWQYIDELITCTMNDIQCDKI